MKDSKLFWEKNAEKYVNSPIKDEATHQKKLALTQKYLSQRSRVLEFGCGSGSTAVYHAPHVNHIIATDISSKMIEIAKKKASAAQVENISFQQGKVNGLNIQNKSFDAVLGLDVLHLLHNIDGTLHTVHRLLKNNGVFVSNTALLGEVNMAMRGLISVMQFIGLAPYVARLTKKQLIYKLIKAGFGIEKVWLANRESVFIVARKVN